jgi:hypothetical protein
LPDSSGTSARPFLIEATASRWLLAWWLALHGVLVATVFLVHLPMVPGCCLSFLAGLHAGLRHPIRRALLVVSPGGRFALPAEQRFNLALAPATRVGGFWVELVFDDSRGSRLLLIRDQLTDSSWRRLRMALCEWN